jgi:predicted nucleic acid-binding protein
VPVSSCLIDSNILLRWVQPQLPSYSVIQTAIDTLTKWDAQLCYTSQNLGEFWNTCTRPVDRNGFGLTPEETDTRARIIEAKLQFLADAEAVHEVWRKMLVKHDISGVQVHDARLVASMQVHGISHILTFNTRDFTRYSQIIAIHPQEVK